MNKSQHVFHFIKRMNESPDAMRKECDIYGRKHMAEEYQVSISTVTNYIPRIPVVRTLDIVAINTMRRGDLTDREVVNHFGITISVMTKACGARKNAGIPPIKRNTAPLVPPERVLNTERWVYKEEVRYW